MITLFANDINIGQAKRTNYTTNVKDKTKYKVMIIQHFRKY